MVTDVVARVADAFMSNVGRAIVNKEEEVRLCPVSYTHLTLPTICSV